MFSRGRFCDLRIVCIYIYYMNPLDNNNIYIFQTDFLRCATYALITKFHLVNIQFFFSYTLIKDYGDFAI